MEYKVKGGFEQKMIYTEWKKRVRGRETLPRSPQVRTGPLHAAPSEEPGCGWVRSRAETAAGAVGGMW